MHSKTRKGKERQTRLQKQEEQSQKDWAQKRERTTEYQKESQQIREERAESAPEPKSRRSNQEDEKKTIQTGKNETKRDEGKGLSKVDPRIPATSSS